jgi:hypothetical protein
MAFILIANIFANKVNLNIFADFTFVKIIYASLELIEENEQLFFNFNRHLCKRFKHFSQCKTYQNRYISRSKY